jgi:CheY-like chemotaxis protein
MNSTRVLVVEDEALIRMAAIQIVGDAGYAVAEAANADEAIAVLERSSDIVTVFTDVSMSGSMCGIRLTLTIRRRWPPIRLIVTSGRLIPNLPELPVGVQFIPKPYSPLHVMNALRVCAG